MSVFPASVSRVPTLLQSQISLANITRTSLDLARTQERLSTGLSINRPSDDAVRAATVSAINERLERGDRLLRNFEHAGAAMSDLDQALGQANELLLEAKSLASSQLTATASAEERAGQAVIIDSLIAGMLDAANRRSVAGFVLGGSDPTRQPLESFLGGVRYIGQGGGLRTDLGNALDIPITLGAGSAIGSTSSRIEGVVDLDPELTEDTRLADLNGARGLGVTPGVIRMVIDGTTEIELDLTDADTAGDVIDAIDSAILQYETDNATTVLGAGRVGMTGERVTFDVAAATPPDPDPEITFEDVGAGTLAADLGLMDSGTVMAFSISFPGGLDVDPRVTLQTPITALASVSGSLPLGSIVVRAQGQAEVVDLSGAETLQDVTEAIELTGLGIRARINPDSNTIEIVNETGAAASNGLSIEDSDDGIGTAGLLGIRSFAPELRVSELNDGRGVGVVSGATDPVSGLPDPSRNVDFVITLGNGLELSIDFQPSDLGTVQDVVDAINTQAQTQLAAAGEAATLFTASVGTGPNGIAFTQDTLDPGITGGITVTRLNNSQAAYDLGLIDRSYDAATGTYLGDDVARVRPDNVFSSLLDLRDALLNDDTFGITLAGEKLDGYIARLAESRAIVGGQAERVETETRFTEDRLVLDETLRSGLQDADFAAEATRFTLLQTQLQAAYQAAASAGQLSLLNFLG